MYVENIFREKKVVLLASRYSFSNSTVGTHVSLYVFFPFEVQRFMYVCTVQYTTCFGMFCFEVQCHKSKTYFRAKV